MGLHVENRVSGFLRLVANATSLKYEFFCFSALANAMSHGERHRLQKRGFCLMALEKGIMLVVSAARLKSHVVAWSAHGMVVLQCV